MSVELIEVNPTLTVEQRLTSGCYYHRIHMPLQHTEFVPKTQTLMFSRMSGFLPEQLKEMRAAGINIIADVDDSLYLNKTHVLYDTYKRNDTTAKMLACLEYASMVIVTNDQLASEISKFHKNVQVVWNGLNFDKGQFTKDESEKVFDVVYAGSVTHEEDLSLINGCLDGRSVKLCGLSDHPAWGRIVKKIPQATCFEYKPLESYMESYDGAKIGLTPLVANSFNSCKSNLKVLEIGAKGLPAISSRVHPYMNPIDKDVVIYANKKESWLIQIKKLLNDEVYYQEKSQQLFEHVREHYHLDKLNLIRKDLVENL